MIKLSNGLYRIKNKKTGQTKDVAAQDLSQYGLSAPQQVNPIQNIGQDAQNALGNVGNLLKNINLGAIPSSLNDQSRNLIGLNTGMNQQVPLKQNVEEGMGAGAYGLGMENPATLGGKALQGATSGLMQNVASGQGANPTSDAISALTSGTLNPIVGGISSLIPKALSNVAYGPAGKAIPDIVRETGQKIMKIGGTGSQKALQDIGQKIGDVYKSSGIGLNKSDIFDMLDNTSKLDENGNAIPSNLEALLRKAGVTGINDINEAKNIFIPATGKGAKATVKSSQIEREFNSTLSDYVSKNPAISEAVSKINDLRKGTTELPAEFWQQFKKTIKPAQSVYDNMKKNPSFVPSGEDKARMQLSNQIDGKLVEKIAQKDPQAAKQLMHLNSLYGPAKKIAKGQVENPNLHGYMKAMGLAGGALAVQSLAAGKPVPINYETAMGGLALSPLLAAPLSSMGASPESSMITNAIASLIASRLAGKATQNQASSY